MVCRCRVKTTYIFVANILGLTVGHLFEAPLVFEVTEVLAETCDRANLVRVFVSKLVMKVSDRDWLAVLF